MTEISTHEPAAAATRVTGDIADSTLRKVEDRVLWLSTAIVDHANRVRPNPAGLKVGGHQASSASMVTLMTSLYFEHLGPEDRVSVKPHASPVLHAIEFLLGQLDAKYLTTLREYGGLQSYPSRLKDPVPADYSTGSVGIGATAPIWGALSRRYVGSHFTSQRRGRQYSLVGDAELDEGAIWEAVLDPMTAELGEIVWIIDFNRQSLDRVLPTLGSERIEAIFAASGWQVLTIKYGAGLEVLFSRPGGDALRERINSMSNPEYQRLLRHDAAELVAQLPGDGPRASEIRALLASVDSGVVASTIRELGGHDFGAIRNAFDSIDDARPTVIIAYTVKGYGLAMAGHPQNHSALLKLDQLEELAARLGTSVDQPWEGFAPESAAGQLCSAVRNRLERTDNPVLPALSVPKDLGRTPAGTANTQSALGRTLLDLSRAAPDVGRRIVTVAPDVSSSTNLGGWVNKFGVWSTQEHHDWFADDGETILHWRERPTGQHIELGIAEVNLVCLLGELGTTWSRWGEPLLPIGVVYDPFVARALEPWSFGMYAGGQSILVGTPSGVTLAPEGGAHQSITSPSVGLEQPGCTTWEPAFALDTEWCLLEAIGNLGKPGGRSAYLRLSTRAIPQSLAMVPEDPDARERRRRPVVAGGYAMRRVENPDATVVVVGAVTPEALEAADRLAEHQVNVDVICLTSPDQIFRAYQASRGLDDAATWILEALFPQDRRRPVITLLDGHPHTLAFIAAITGTRGTHLGVSNFGQSGDLESVYKHHKIDAGGVVSATLDLLARP